MNGAIDILWVLEGRLSWRDLMDLNVVERSHIIRRVTELKAIEEEQIEGARGRRR